MTRRTAWMLLAVIAACGIGAIGNAAAQGYPQRPIRILVGFPPGGGADIMARILAPKLSQELGVPVIVENRGGASATIAVGLVARAPADGYTLLLSTPTDTVQPSLNDALPYNYERDLTHISMFAVAPMALVVNAAVPASNVKELIALAKSQPGKLNYGSAGIGSAVHLCGALFSQMTGADIVHVPYKGASDAIKGVAAGEIPMAFVVLSGAMPMIQAGKVRALAITSLERSALTPSIPTLNESGVPGYQLAAWWGVSGPAGLPKGVVERLSRAIAKVVNTPEMKDQFAQQGIEPRTDSPEEFAAFIHQDIAMDARLLKSTGVGAENATTRN